MTLLIRIIRFSALVFITVIQGGVLTGQSIILDSFDERSITIRMEPGKEISTISEVETGRILSVENIVESAPSIYRIDLLEPATAYKVEIEGDREQYFSTRSTSTGEMKVYFNNGVNTSYSDGSMAAGTTIGVLERDLINLIDDAITTIDFCAYNTSRTSIVNALRDAHARGVQVRVIADDETSNTGWQDNPPFPVVKGNQGDDLMHNKFIIVDADEMMNSWVITGAMNFTKNQMETDPNHQIWIQDKSLAQAYTLEFEEMWGSNGPEPNISVAKFGADKNDNTPHLFEIGGSMVELYFSPSDNTAFHIGEAIKSADTDINCGLLLFTHFDLRDRIIERHNAGTKVRMIIENTSGSASVISDLNAVGIVVEDHPPSQIFHHKYAIIDEGTDSDPQVVTGSHNWTFSADNFNDENTLIIHDQSIANIFHQEFRRWWEELSTSASTADNRQLILVYPNPVIDYLAILSNNNMDELCVYDISGKRVLNLADCGLDCRLDLQSLEKGIYLLQINRSYYQRFIKL